MKFRSVLSAIMLCLTCELAKAQSCCGASDDPICSKETNRLVEVPSGLVDGTNATFFLSAPAITPDDINICVDGQTKRVGTDYFIAGQMLTFQQTAVPSPSASLIVSYQTQFAVHSPRVLAGEASLVPAIVRSTLIHAVERETEASVSRDSEVTRLALSADRNTRRPLRSLSLLGERLSSTFEPADPRAHRSPSGTQGVEGIGDVPYHTDYSELLGTRTLILSPKRGIATEGAAAAQALQQPRSLQMLERKLSKAQQRSERVSRP